MDKLQYDSLYKFLVSLGLIMIALPIAVLAYLLNSEPILINQHDFESLSQISQQMLTNRDKLLVILRYIFPWFAGLFILVGIALLIYGLSKWQDVQKNLDKKLDAEATIQTLNALQMDTKEVNNKIEAEITESSGHANLDGHDSAASSQNLHQGMPQKYMEIETKCFDYAVTKYGRKYQFTPNIQMGRYSYDLIGVSKKDNIDLLVELKYWSTPQSTSSIIRILKRIAAAGVNYETIAHRNFQSVLIIVTPENRDRKSVV